MISFLRKSIIVSVVLVLLWIFAPMLGIGGGRRKDGHGIPED